MNLLYEFWKQYPFPESTEAGIKNYHGLHPEDLKFLQLHYGHLFDHPMKYKIRKQKEIEKFQQWMHQINGRYIKNSRQQLVFDEHLINIAVPDAYHGNLGQADIVVLLINPKYDPDTVQNERQKQQIYHNMHKEQSSFAPCEFIDGRLNTENQPNWWYERMFCHIAEEKEISSQQIMAIQYLPYRSFYRKDVPEFKDLLPSQLAAVETVKQAITQNKLIVVRGTDRTRWFETVPALKDYDQLYVFTNYKHPTLSRYETMAYHTYVNQEILKLKGQLKQEREKDWQRLLDVF